MMTPEKRAIYLLRIAARYLRNNYGVADYTIFYDGATCDGTCLAEDCEIAANDLQDALELEKEDVKD